MKGRNWVYWALLLLAVSCAQEEEEIGKADPVIAARSVTFTAETDGVEVLIFGRNDTGFTYRQKVNSGWSAEGQVKIPLQLGDYQFLFYKTPQRNTRVEPDPLTGCRAEEVKIALREDESHPGYRLPADEVFLPETSEMAGKVYEIRGETTVHNTLTRAVGQVVVQLKRGVSENGKFDSIPYPAGESIMDHIENITLEISNVGEAVSPSGGSGSSRILWTNITAPVLTESGFALIEGPFVFPSGNGENSTIEVTLTPRSGSPFPVMSRTLEGKVVRNEKLVVTLWLTSTYQLIHITVTKDPITEQIGGDQGIWE